MDTDELLDAFAARVPAGRWHPYSPLTTVEQREVIAIARTARRELKAERARATRLAAQAQELMGELEMLRRGE